MGSYQLREMSVGEILDGAIAIFRRHFRLFLGIGITTQGIPTLLTIYVEVGGGVLAHPVAWLTSLVLSTIGGLIAAAATLRAVSHAYLDEAPTLEDALSYAVGRIGALFIAGLAKYLIIFIGLFFFFIPGLVLAAGFALVAQVVVLERPAASLDSLGRSWNLTKGFKFKVIFLGFVVYLITYVPVFAAQAVAFMLAGDATLQGGISTPAAVLLATGSLTSLVLFPIVGCAFTLLYYDLRLRKEAFDLDLLGEQMGSHTKTA